MCPDSRETPDNSTAPPEARGLIGRLIYWCLTNKLVVALALIFIVGWGFTVAPFDWQFLAELRRPVPVDAIPDIGENQQIVFTEWPGRSPQDVEDQISYPLTVALLGVPGVRTIRSTSMFGFSSVYVIFEEGVDFYWSRSRLLEKLNSLPAGALPEGVLPALGPDATALGQIFWYTLEGRDPDGNPIGGWDLEELRTIQDWYVRYGLQSAAGVSEVASVGGFVREYQVDVDPDAMRAYDVTLPQVYQAVRASNIDVGARTIELNRVEYVVRGVGFIRDLTDIEQSVVAVRDHVPVTIDHIAQVGLGPALRRGVLDKDGAEAVGGVVVARYGANPLAVITNVKAAIVDISPGLPAKAVIDWRIADRAAVEQYARAAGFDAFAGGELNQDAWVEHLRRTDRDRWPAWLNRSQVTIVPFYDRAGLIYETLGTLNHALIGQMLITLVVVIVMLAHLRTSLVIGAMLPLSVLLCFIAMKTFGVDANIVSLSGIAIAIGTIVDMGIVICENTLRRLEEAPPEAARITVVHHAASEVGSAVLTAVATTVVSFLPVFTMLGSEGKLFRPLAFTKTFALIASIIIALTIVPSAIYLALGTRRRVGWLRLWLYGLLAATALAIVAYGVLTWALPVVLAGCALLIWSLARLFHARLSDFHGRLAAGLVGALIVVLVASLLSRHWLPLGPVRGQLLNFLFVVIVAGAVLLFFMLYQRIYTRVLRWCLDHKRIFLAVVIVVIVGGAVSWLGFERVFNPIPQAFEAAGADPDIVRRTPFWVTATHAFPGLGREFMPPLDEGAFLYMPTTMTHASIGEVREVLALQDMAFHAIPEVESAVGKLGRAESPLDPAPISMIETVINYRTEFITDSAGRPISFRYDEQAQDFVRDDEGNLIPDERGRPYRQWRDHISSPDDIWDEIVAAADIPGTTSAPRLQPISARLVMLQSGVRAPMAVQIRGADLDTIDAVALDIERLIKDVPGVNPAAVIADRVVGKPYLEIHPSRGALARYGVRMRDFQDIIEIAIGGRPTTMTVMGRRRFPVRVRYLRELRDEIEAIERILVPGADGVQIPLSEVAEVRYVRGPQAIRSEDTFLVGYVLFDKLPGYAEVDVVESCRDYLDDRAAAGEFSLPAGVSIQFVGLYENQVRARRTLAIVMPLALFLIFMILYFQFRRVSTTLLVFSGIFVAWSGGFILLWLYGQSWFLNFSLFEVSFRELFQVSPINLSVAVWVGFLALFGIATDDGVVQCTYLEQVFRDRRPDTISAIRAATVEAGARRIRPCLMTSATTILALLPVLTSTGRGSDVMVPMAIPSFGGMLVALLSILVAPTLYSLVAEIRLRATDKTPAPPAQ